MPKQDRYCLATLRSQLLDHPVAPGEWHARRACRVQPGLWIPGSPLRSAPDDEDNLPDQARSTTPPMHSLVS